MINELILPLVESVIDQNQEVDLTDVLIIGSQHILETTHAMFRSLYRLGLKPENVHLIGKCYSTCKEVYDEMNNDGIRVSPDSFIYSSHQPYDSQYSNSVCQFLSNHIKKIYSRNYKRIVVLDDGGKCIDYLSKNIKPNCPLIAIEQTTAGYEAIRNKKLSFPVINVARSPVKLTLESPMIAQAAAERLYMSLESRNLFPESALIIGGGAIGQAMRKHLSDRMDLSSYDIKDFEKDSLKSMIGKHPLIIGCTGTTSISCYIHNLIAPGSVLVSVSSSDREFDAVHLRRKIIEKYDCHEDLTIDNILLVNSGFPVNFDGDRENIHPDKIQLTIALIASGILHSCRLKHLEPLILPLLKTFEKQITEQFQILQSPEIYFS